MATFFCRLTRHQTAKNGYFWGRKCACFCVFLPKNRFLHAALRTTRHGLRPPWLVARPSRAWWRRELAQHCCGVVAASGNGGGCKGNWSARRSRSPRGLRVASLHAGLCLHRGVHTQARPQAGASPCARRSRNGVEGRLPRGGRGWCGSHPRQLHSCRPELEPDSEWRTSHLVPAAGQPVPISMSRHRPHQLPRRSAQP